ncbi:hypothetical protein V8B97DRAFT_2003617 [Scleroderma yunnanense]
MDSGKLPSYRSSYLLRFHPYPRVKPSARERVMAALAAADEDFITSYNGISMPFSCIANSDFDLANAIAQNLNNVVHTTQSLNTSQRRLSLSSYEWPDLAVVGSIGNEAVHNEKESQVVDLILQRSLSDVDPDMKGLDDLLITIPSCGHTFTVETLDGHCSVSEYYRWNSESRWTGLDAPSGFRRPPTCPTCLSVVKTPRYGRVYKRAELDILERNVAAQMSRCLGETQNSMETFTPAEKKIILVNEAVLISLSFKEKSPGKKQIDAQKRAKEAVLNTSKQVPVPLTGISPENKELHTIHPSVLNVWNKAIRELLNVYKQAICVAETRSAHSDAWEASLSRLYECELQSMEDNPRTAARNPQVHAMRMEKMKIGQPRPLADRRFLVEAFWLTLRIRLVLTDLIRTWLEEISKRNSNVIKKTAKDSEARRQVTRTVLWKMRVELERFRFNLFIDELLIRARELQTNSGQCMREALREHCQRKNDPEETDWLSTNFSSIAQDIVDEWGEIERTIRLDTFYEPLSLQERMEIVKAFGYGRAYLFPSSSFDADHLAVAGNFYNCSNGHMFIIGDVHSRTSLSLHRLEVSNAVALCEFRRAQNVVQLLEVVIIDCCHPTVERQNTKS